MVQHANLGIAPPSIYRVILKEITPVKDKKILDVPCGSGAFSQHLTIQGAESVGVDIVPADRHKPAVVADMNCPFPFADDSFDLVISIEGIEHIHSAFHLIQECYRILNSGGKLILSTPNIQNIRSRIKFLLRGTFFWFDPYEITRMGHVNVVPYFILKHILKDVGFVKVFVRGNANIYPRVPVVLCRLMQRLFSKPTTDDFEQNSATIVNAQNLIVFAKKATNRLEK